MICWSPSGRTERRLTADFHPDTVLIHDGLLLVSKTGPSKPNTSAIDLVEEANEVGVVLTLSVRSVPLLPLSEEKEGVLTAS
jgi:hypothetical protein